MCMVIYAWSWKYGRVRSTLVWYRNRCFVYHIYQILNSGNRHEQTNMIIFGYVPFLLPPYSGGEPEEWPFSDTRCYPFEWCTSWSAKSISKNCTTLIPIVGDQQYLPARKPLRNTSMYTEVSVNNSQPPSSRNSVTRSADCMYICTCWAYLMRVSWEWYPVG